MAFGDVRGTLTGGNNSIPASFATTAGSISVSVGDLILTVVGQQTNLTVTACGDNLHGGSTHTAVNAGTDSGTVTGRAFWHRVTTAGTLTTVTAVCSSSTNDGSISVVVLEGPFRASPLDANPANVQDTTTPFTGPATGTLSQADEYIAAFYAKDVNTVFTASSPNVIRVNQQQSANICTGIGGYVVSATTTQSPAWTGGGAVSSDVLITASFRKDTGIAVGAASGTGSSSVAGKSDAASTGATSGTGASSVVGASNAEATGSSSGSGVLAGQAGSIASASGTGAASGVSPANSKAVVSWAEVEVADMSVAEASGVGAASGVADVGTAVGSASGVGAASGVGNANFDGVGNASGTGAASGVGASTADGVGNASGTGAASGVGNANFDGVGNASGTGTATGISETGTATASASGTGAASGVGASTAASVGSASGTGAASGVGASTVAAVGAATGLSNFPAVHFDGGTYIYASAITTPGGDNQFFSFSGWCRMQPPGPSEEFVFMGDVQVNDTIEFDWTGGGRVNLFGDPGPGSISVQPQVDFADGGFHHFIGTLDLGATRRGQMLIDGVDYGGFFTFGSGAQVFALNGKEWTIGAAGTSGGNHGFKITCDMADLWIAPGVNLLDGSGNIDSATLAKFRDATGKPVDLGADGSLPTGTAPAIYLTGDASEFATNRGSGGSFSVDAGALTDADNGPGTRAIGAALFAAAGSASGTGAASGVGNANFDGVGNASGTGAAIGISETGTATGSASGTGTATGVGASTVDSVGSATGTGTATGVGASTAASVGSASGTGAASGVGNANFEGVGSATGTGVALGASDIFNVGSAAGVGAASGVGQSTAESVGAASGTGAASGVGAAQTDAVGNASGTGAASATGVAAADGVGSASGTGVATGVGASTAAGVGSAAGVGNLVFTGDQTSLAQASGTGTATGVGASTAASVGSAPGTGAASGVGQSTANAVGAASGTGAASGSGVGGGVGSGSASGTSTCAATGASLANVVAISAAVGAALGIGAQIGVSTRRTRTTGVGRTAADDPRPPQVVDADVRVGTAFEKRPKAVGE